MLGIKLNHVSKRGPWWQKCISLSTTKHDGYNHFCWTNFGWYITHSLRLHSFHQIQSWHEYAFILTKFLLLALEVVRNDNFRWSQWWKFHEPLWEFNNASDACIVSDDITIRLFVTVEKVRNDFISGCTSWASFYEWFFHRISNSMEIS